MGFDSSNPYGPIESWDVSRVESFEQAFMDMTSFNEDISAWDVSSATSFKVSPIVFPMDILLKKLSNLPPLSVRRKCFLAHANSTRICPLGMLAKGESSLLCKFG